MTSLRDGELETAAEMRLGLARGEVTAVQLVRRALDRAERWQPVTNAFSQLWPDEALARAEAVDAARRRGDAPPLAGIPIAVKDLFDVTGHETTGCSRAYAGTVARTDAVVVRRVLDAGMVIIGKTNQHELAAGGTNVPSACGRARNPWDRARMTGGSSGGSAAAVAAGIVPFALGSDTGGSIRIPAAMCGTFGLKPTTGQLPLDGLMPLAPSLDCPGPMAATVEDLRTLYTVMRGGDPPADIRSASPRVAIPEGFFTDSVHVETLAALSRVEEALRDGGIAVTRIDGGGLDGVRETWMRVCTPEFAAAHPALRDPARRALLAPQVRGWLEQGERFSSEEVEDAKRERSLVHGWFDGHLRGVDAVLVPTCPYPAPPIDATHVDLGDGRTVEADRVGPGWMTCSVNLAGVPAINLPVETPSGLPTGVSLVGRAGDERTLLALAAMWERAAGAPGRPSLAEHG